MNNFADYKTCADLVNFRRQARSCESIENSAKHDTASLKDEESP